MSHEADQKKENLPQANQLAVSDGGLLFERRARTFTSGELRLDADMEQLMGSVCGDDGEPVIREFRRAIYGETHPHRVLARYTERAARACNGSEWVEQRVRAIIARLDRFVSETFAKHRRRRAA